MEVQEINASQSSVGLFQGDIECNLDSNRLLQIFPPEVSLTV